MPDAVDLDAIVDPYPEFSEQRDRINAALNKLGLPAGELWAREFGKIQRSPKYSDADEVEQIKRTMLMFTKWLSQHPDLDQS